MTENATTTNLMTTSSSTTPPIRIGQPLSSSSPIAVSQGQQQQQHQQQQQQPLSLLQHQSNSMGATSGSDSPGAAGGAGSSGSGSAAQQHSSSAPNTATSSGYHMQLQSGGGGSPVPPAGSNQSLAIGAISSSITPPNSAGLRQSGGLANWANDSRDKYDGNQTDKTPEASKLNRKESYKAQRKNYRREKKRVASELLNSLQDPAVVVLADWLKVRGTLKSWTKLWCVLKPGLLLIYKSPKTKSSHWVGTILLTSCQVIERPSKKDGFCFKLFHPLEQSIWAPRGPDKETIGAVVQPLPTAYLIFRAPSQAAGKCWMDALELSLRCSALLLRSNSNSGAVQSAVIADAGQMSHETQWSEADYEKHFNDHENAAKAQPKRYAKYLSASDAECGKSLGNSEYSLPSRSQTPLFQQLYLSMTNWERIGPEFQRFKRLPKTLRDYRGSRSSVGDLSDASSVADGASRFLKESAMTMPLSLKLKRRRQKQLNKSSSLGSLDRRCPVGVIATTTSSTSSSFSSPAKSNPNAGKRGKGPRPLSAPPMIINVIVPSAESNLDVDSQNEGATAVLSAGDTDSDSDVNDGVEVISQDLPETPYIPIVEEEFGTVGEQVEELGEENKSLIWCLVKQVRPGMDLSKVVLPTFILEPRSFLDKLSDSYYHADILSRAVQEDDPFTRMKLVVQWYLSGFYKKPKGLKKPYNPILGETFRCYWQHENGSRTYYIAEQVSHHPPISAFYVTNRQDGFCISCSILAKSKFYGNSTSAVLEGVATLTLLPRGESYTLTTPYAHCKGILMGTLSMELGGKINIECENTGYKTELEFKLKPFLGGSDSTNVVAGKIRLGKETLATISGHWDTEMRIKDAKTQEESVLLCVDTAIKQKRLTRHLVPLDAQLANESERLWQLVSAAIARDDQVGATEEKTVLEEAQRKGAKERAALLTDWIPMHFQQDMNTGQWIYKYADLRPWDPRNDVKQFETDYKVLTKTRHQAPMVRTASMISGMRADSQQSGARKVARKSKQVVAAIRSEYPLDSSGTDDEGKLVPSKEIRRLTVALDQVNKALEDHKRQLALIQTKLERIQYAPPSSSSFHSVQSGSGIRLILPDSLPQSVVTKTIICAFVGVFMCLCLKWFAK